MARLPRYTLYLGTDLTQIPKVVGAFSNRQLRSPWFTLQSDHLTLPLVAFATRAKWYIFWKGVSQWSKPDPNFHVKP